MANSKAVVSAWDGVGIVLWFTGEHIVREVEREDIHEDDRRTLYGLGLHYVAPNGISIWEGDYKVRQGPDEGWDTEPVGAFRAPTPAEWAGIIVGKSPWELEKESQLFIVTLGVFSWAVMAVDAAEAREKIKCTELRNAMRLMGRGSSEWDVTRSLQEMHVTNTSLLSVVLSLAGRG